jgi:hypothetical protein
LKGLMRVRCSWRRSIWPAGALNARIRDLLVWPNDRPTRSYGGQDLLEILDDRDAVRSTIIASQPPHAEWHVVLGDPAIAAAILDRLVHNAHESALTAPSQGGERTTSTKK